MEHPYIKHLSKDSVFDQIVKSTQPYVLKKDKNLTLFFYQSIINQQLSTKVGDIFFKRFLNIFNGNVPTSQQVVETSIEDLRAIGLSNSKANYIQNVARFDIENGLNFEELDQLPDEDVIKIVTSIKGIGKWSAQNFLISALGREDIFSGEDLIIQNVMISLYNLDKTDKKKLKTDLERISLSWSPYRTYASLHIWQWNSLKTKNKNTINNL